ncbi:MAG: hypothetical protein JWN89_83 [Parcubacteria group bacterium]|nr:hypothetical protein [Parcubacteria group bacterium]
MYKTKALQYDNRVRIFWTLVSLCVASLALYVYGVNATVRNTVVRAQLEAEASNISAHLGEMEFAYISLKNKVSLEVAYARGYQDVVSPTFISRSSRSLSLNTKR